MAEVHTDKTGRNTVAVAEEEVYTINEAARILKISRSSCYAAIRRGEIPSIKIGNRMIRVPKVALHHWLESGARLTALVLAATNGFQHYF